MGEPGFEVRVLAENKVQRLRDDVVDAVGLDELRVFLDRDGQRLVDLDVVLALGYFRCGWVQQSLAYVNFPSLR